MKSYHARGKLLISGEYMVMHGSRALAVPLKLGQSLQVTASGSHRTFKWTAHYQNRPWFSAEFDPCGLKVIRTSESGIALRLKDLLDACLELRPAFRDLLPGTDAATYLDFSPEYGFGSSSTLTSLVAEWAGVDPFKLHFSVFKGSGYDVACASAQGPIFYMLRGNSPVIDPAAFHPPFSDQIYFAWLGKKQSTAAHLETITAHFHADQASIRLFSRITAVLAGAKTLDEFRGAMEEHESALSCLLGYDRVSTRFPGIPASVKSLGAWGGDFVMVATETDKASLLEYLRERGISIVYGYKELVYDGTGIQSQA